MSVAGQVGEHSLGSTERSLGGIAGAEPDGLLGERDRFVYRPGVELALAKIV